MNFIKNNLNSILASVLGTMFFLYFLEPIFNFFGSFILKYSLIINDNFSRDFYSKIAHLELMDFSFMGMFITFLFVGCLGIGFGFKSIFCLFRSAKEGKVQVSNALQNENRVKARIVSKKQYFMLSTIFFGTSFVLFSIISVNFYQLKLISSFKQHIRIIAPYLSSQEEKELISQWSLMSNHDDYIKIYSRIDKSFNKNNLKKPENKIYSITTF